jgi:transposase-like protein
MLGEHGLLKQLTRLVIERALEAELTEDVIGMHPVRGTDVALRTAATARARRRCKRRRAIQS